MNTTEESQNPFPDIADPESLSPEDRDRYLFYWASRSSGERMQEVMRLNRAKWGDEVFERGMDKSKLEVVDMKTGKVLKVIKTNR